MLISNKDTVEESANAARLALPWIRQQALTVCPVNYAVAYEYVSNRNPDLRETADLQLKKHKKLTQDFVNTLFIKFLSGEKSEKTSGIETIRSDLHGLFSDTLLAISGSNQEIYKYKKSLANANNMLFSSQNADSAREIIDEIITKTSNIHKTSTHLQSNLQTTCVELTSIRSEFQRIQHETIKDPLTGILNRRGLNQFLEKEINEESKENLSLLMIEIDHFQRFNDTFGHSIGDEILKYTSRILKDNIKGKDIVARYGGKVFIILLPYTELDKAECVALGICQIVRADKLKQISSGKELGKITVSIGLASLMPNENPADLINRADKALYSAKNQGRDRVVCYSEALARDN